MKVGELIAELQRLPQDLDVIMSKDEEGNAYYDVDSPQLSTGDEAYALMGDDDELVDVVIIYPGGGELNMYWRGDD